LSKGRADVLSYEKRLWEEGLTYVAGVDEAGRGSLYGDVVAACVIFPPHSVVKGVNDSKKLSPKQREELYEVILRKAVAVGIGRADAAQIDRWNIRQATRMAMRQAVEQLSIRPEYILVDAEQIECPIPQLAIVRGDQQSQTIAAASIVAKVTRDRLCQQWEARDPGYGIAQHKGYATAYHRERILQLGPSPHHRRSFLGKLLQVLGEERHA
jgi:ribonuclease HII